MCQRSELSKISQYLRSADLLGMYISFDKMDAKNARNIYEYDVKLRYELNIILIHFLCSLTAAFAINTSTR